MNQVELQSTRFRAALIAWYRLDGRMLPWRTTADPYRILVSEMMLQQTQVVTVLRYYDRWFQLFPTLESLARADESDVLHAWQGLGYYSRARHLHQCARWVVEHCGGELPCDVKSLLQLPGIGRYTAGAVASFAFNLPAPILDANVTRVLARLINLEIPIDREPGKSALWELAERLVAGPEPGTFNSALMELGALICTPRAPACECCPVKTYCLASNPQNIPLKSIRAEVVRRQENYRWIRRGDQVLLRKCAGPRWKGMWTLPLADEIEDDEVPVLEMRHSVTRFVIHLKVFSGQAPTVLAHDNSYHRVEDLPDLPMPTPHRRSVDVLLGALERG
jgi:A/G-specific adenine glycosylase